MIYAVSDLEMNMTYGLTYEEAVGMMKEGYRLWESEAIDKPYREIQYEAVGN
jgi:predicted RNase H-like HicB family nuclease